MYMEHAKNTRETKSDQYLGAGHWRPLDATKDAASWYRLSVQEYLRNIDDNTRQHELEGVDALDWLAHDLQADSKGATLLAYEVCSSGDVAGIARFRRENYPERAEFVRPKESFLRSIGARAFEAARMPSQSVGVLDQYIVADHLHNDADAYRAMFDRAITTSVVGYSDDARPLRDVAVYTEDRALISMLDSHPDFNEGVEYSSDSHYPLYRYAAKGLAGRILRAQRSLD